MEMDDRSDSDEVRLEKEPKTEEELSEEKEDEEYEEEDEDDEEEEEVQQEEKVKAGPDSMSLSKTRPGATPAPASEETVPAVPQLTIFYGGSVKVFEGIPEEKVMEIMRIAAAAVANKTTDAKNIETDNASSTPPQPKMPNTAAAVGSLLAQLCPSPKSSLCKIQAEVPIARRISLQRFLEKRRDRLVSKNPYPSSPAMKVENDMKI